MFRETIEYTLQFVGAHRMDAGCTSAALGDFIAHDLLPFMGWSSSNSLRDTIFRVTLQECYTSGLVVYASQAEVSASLPAHTSAQTTTSTPNAAAETTRQTRRRRPRIPATDAEDSANRAATASSLSDEVVLLPLETVFRLLDENRVAWHHRSAGSASSDTGAPSTSSSSSMPQTTASDDGQGQPGDTPTTASRPASLGGRVRLFVCPTQQLRERVLGISLHTETVRSACDFLSDVALHGYDVVYAKRGAERFGAYKSHLVTSGIRALMKRQLAVRCYLHDPTTHVTSYRVFPLYAAPLTELEKKATGLHHDSNGEDGDDADADSHRFPWTLLQRQAARAWRPLDHFFARQRRLSGRFPSVTFDLTLVKYIVQTSPEHKLLFSDALRAVLRAHGIADHGGQPWQGKGTRAREDQRLRKMFFWAGLRVAEAFVDSRGKRRRVRIVVTAEDLRQRLEAQRAREAQRQYRRLQRRHRRDENEEGHSDTAAAVALKQEEEEVARDVKEDDEHGNETLVDVTAGSHSDDEDDHFLDQSDSDGDDTRPRHGVSRDSSVAVTGAALQRRLEAADHPFCLSPDWPLELQAGREAERRPLLMTRILPNVELDGSHRSRARPLAAYMVQYMAQRRTLVTHAIITPRARKSFTKVYERLPVSHDTEQGGARTAKRAHSKAEDGTAQPALSSPSHTVKDEPSSAAEATPSQSSARPADATGLSQHGAAAAPLSTGHAPAASPPATDLPPLPKGVSQYAVDVVLAALNEAPHKALPLAKLASVVDLVALNRRILPYLRQANRVYTTGVTSSVRKRIGIVALRHDGPPLDEATKRLVAQDDPDTARQPRRTLLDRFLKPTPNEAAPSSATIVSTDLVLPSVPAMVEGVAPSLWAQRLAQSTTRAARYVDTLMQARNGYTSYTEARAGRLHAELWRQWWLRAPHASQPPHTSFTLTTESILADMTLSTYCIVFGVPAADLAALVRCARWRVTPAAAVEAPSASDEDSGADGHDTASSAKAAAADVAWSTPLHALPQDLRRWCGVDSGQPDGGVSELFTKALIQQLETLQRYGLVHLLPMSEGERNTVEPPTLESSAYRMRVALSPCGTVRQGHTAHFYQPHYTPTSTLLAVLQCWAPRWRQLHGTRVRGSRALCQADPDPTFPAMVALQKYLRTTLQSLGRIVYQHQGFDSHLIDLRRAEQRQRWRMHRDLARRTREGHALGLRQRRRLHTTTLAGRSRKRSGGATGVLRTDVDMAGVAESATQALESAVPRKRLQDLVQLLERSRRSLLATHPLHIPSRVRSTIGGVATTMDRRVPSESALLAAGELVATYNPLLRMSTLHLSTLGRTLDSVNDPRLRVPWLKGGKAAHSHPPLGAAGADSLAGLGGPAGSVEALKRSVQSVLTPDLIVVADANQSAHEGEDGRCADTAPRAAAVADRLAAIAKALSPPPVQATGASSALTTTPQLPPPDGNEAHASTAGSPAELVPLDELAKDVLRMILLSDRAHYSASIARTLLLQMPRVTVAKARATLQQLPSFRLRSGTGSRIPKLELGSQPSFLANSVVAATAQPCANTALLHACAAQTEAVARRDATRPHCCHDLFHLGTGAPAALMEVELRAQPTLDITRAEEADVARRATLRLPSLDWPHAAAVLELERCRGGGQSRLDEANAEGEDASPRRGRPPLQRTVAPESKPVRDAPGSDTEDEEDGGAAEEEATRGARASHVVEQQLYPARRLGAGVQGTGRIPTALPPNPAEQQAVLAAVASLEACGRSSERSASTPAMVRLSGDAARGRGCGIAYPSIFHHVDGAFHPFVWHTFLTVLYRLVQHVPGIMHEDLLERLMASGVVSRRAAEAGIHHLTLSGVLRQTAMKPELNRNPFREVNSDDDAVAGGWSWSYHATVPSTGMWDIAKLDTAPLGMCAP